MNNKILYFFPFLYFVKTRISSIHSFFFHLYYEWIPAIVIIFLSYPEWQAAFFTFVVFYLAFISFYELGYILNDHYSVKFEKNPRIRSIAFSNAELAALTAIRIFVFLSIVWLCNMYRNTGFLLFYSLLGVIFFAHNYIKNKEIKVATFLNLAIFRFIAPFVFIIDKDFLYVLFPSILLNYVFYRSLSYLESKSLLSIQGRKTSTFKISYYLLLMPISIILSFFFNDLMPFYINIYYLIFWIGFGIVSKETNKMNS